MGRVETGVAPHTRRFCAACGSNLFWTAGPLTGFAGGCLNDPTLLAPRRVVRYAQRLPWAAFPAACEIADDQGSQVRPNRRREGRVLVGESALAFDRGCVETEAHGVRAAEQVCRGSPRTGFR
jgi:hypothetical protein